MVDSGHGHSTHQAGQVRAARAPRDAFDALKRESAQELAGLLDQFWGPIEEQVRVASLAGHDFGASQEDRVAVLALRQRAQMLVLRFREHIEQDFEAWLAAKPAATPEGERGLSLMSEGELQMQLAAQAIGEELAHDLNRPLDALEDRMAGLAALLGAPRRMPAPLRPESVVTAFVDALHGDEMTPGVRPLVFRQLHKRLAALLPELYGRFNARLEDAGFGPVPVGGARMHAHHAPHAPTAQAQSASTWVPDGGMVEHMPVPAPGMAAATQAGARVGGSTHAGPVAWAQGVPATAQPGAAGHHGAEGVPLRYRDIVREQLRAWRSDIGHGATGWVDADSDYEEGDILGASDMLNVASLLQGDDATPFTRALAGESAKPLAGVMRDELLSGVRQMGFAPRTTRFSVDEEDAIDLVGLLFQSLFKANDLIERVAPLYGRLVMPYLKVALTDDTLFNRRSHPARQMLDAMTEACDGNAADTPQEREALDKVEHVVDQVVGGYQEDLAVFELASNELRELLDQQRRRGQLNERRTAEAIHGRERLQQARRDSRTLVASRLSERSLSRSVADFLREEWQLHLTQTILRHGAGSARFNEAVALGDGLMQADADAARARGAMVAEQLLALQQGMAEAFTSAGLDAGAARDVLAGIVSALAHPDAPRGIYTLDEDDLGADAADEGPAALRLVSGTDDLEFDPAIAERMRRLRVGQGLRFTDDDGHESMARIAWISPLTSRFLVVNRRGVRKMVVSPEELAALVGSGRAVVRSVDAPFDEAMKQLWQHLNRNSGPNAVAS